MTETPNYSPVVMIYSQLTLGQIEDVFDRYGPKGGACDNYGVLRVVRVRDERTKELKDTNRTICVMSKELFDALISRNLHMPLRSPDRPNVDFRIVPYEVRVNNLPQEGLKKDFFIRLPRDSAFTGDDIEVIIKDKMDPLVKFGVIRPNQFKVFIPLRNKDRQTGRVQGSFFLMFTDDVTAITAAMIKAVIDDTYWDQNKATFNCYWARDVKQEPVQEKPKKWVKKETSTM